MRNIVLLLCTFALSFILISCNQKKESTFAVKEVFDDGKRIYYVNKLNEPTTLCFICGYRKKQLYINIFSKNLAVDYNLWLKKN